MEVILNENPLMCTQVLLSRCYVAHFAHFSSSPVDEQKLQLRYSDVEPR